MFLYNINPSEEFALITSLTDFKREVRLARDHMSLLEVRRLTVRIKRVEGMCKDVNGGVLRIQG